MRQSLTLFFIALFLLTLSFPVAQAQMVQIGEFKVENDQSVEETERIATIEYKPSGSKFHVTGRVQYRNVEGVAYLEMWTVMPDGSRYFSRTFAEYGPMQKIQGTSDWREFQLPFDFMGPAPESVTLEINVVMPGKGTIELSEVKALGGPMLISLDELDWLPVASDVRTTEWFDGRTAGIFATVNGIFGGCYGILCIPCGFLASRGKWRRFVTGVFAFPFALGVVYSVIGIAALLCGQPFRIWWMFVLSGGIMLFVYSFVYFVAIRTMYKQAEQRKMQALDA